MIRIVTLFGLDFGMVGFGGAVLTTETVYNIKRDCKDCLRGEAMGGLDLPPLIKPVRMGGTFFIVLFDAIVDILYAYLDPRIRLGAAAPA